MKCVICKNGETEKGEAVITLSKDDSLIVFKKVPAEVCTNCGEQYIAQEVTKEVLNLANDSLKKGTLIDIRDYIAA